MSDRSRRYFLPLAIAGLVVLAVLLIVLHHVLREPIMKAVVRGDTATVERLVRMDPFLLNTTWPDDLTRSPLLSVAIDNRQKPVVLMLIRRGARVNMGDIIGTTPLHYAAEWGDTDVIRALLDAGAEVDAHDAFGTPLLTALYHGHKDAYYLLVKHGASPAPLHAAATFGDLAGVESALAADPGSLNSVVAHRTPLQEAIAYRHIAVVRYLLERGADVEETAIGIAQESGGQAILDIVQGYATRKQRANPQEKRELAQ